MKHTLEYYQIASTQIDKAIELYQENDYICATTLAGAGEEILGSLLSEHQVQNALNKTVKNIINKEPDYDEKNIRDTLNLPRNMFKHLKIDACEIDIDIEEAARSLILRGIINYQFVRNNITPKMKEFLQVIKTEPPHECEGLFAP